MYIGCIEKHAFKYDVFFWPPPLVFSFHKNILTILNSSCALNFSNCWGIFHGIYILFQFSLLIYLGNFLFLLSIVPWKPRANRGFLKVGKWLKNESHKIYTYNEKTPLKLTNTNTNEKYAHARMTREMSK